VTDYIERIEEDILGLGKRILPAMGIWIFD